MNVGANAIIISVTYNVNLTVPSPSWLADFGLAFTNNAITDGVLLTPGFADTAPGTATYPDILDLAAEGLSFWSMPTASCASNFMKISTM